MKTSNRNFILTTIIIMVLFSFSTVNSQQRGTQPHPTFEKPNKPGQRHTTLNKSFPNANFVSVQKKISTQENILLQEIKSARKTNNRIEMTRFRNELNKIQGVVSKQGKNVGYIRKSETQIPQGDNIDLNQIDYDNNIQSIASVTEQRGENEGRIWAIALANFSGKGDYSQTNFYYSDDNGINWIFYAYAYNPYEFGVPDAMDAEIIEDFTGTKYLYVAYGAITISSNKYICNLINLTISGTVDGSVQRLEWPSFDYNDTVVNYYKPRIATDNAFWNGGAYLYIAACQDSTVGAQTIFGEKVALIDNPYTPTPSINYKSEIFWYYSFNNGVMNGCCDIAWFDDPGNGGGSVMLVESGAYFVTALYLYENADVNFLGTGTYEGYLDPDGIDKSSAYIASNGLYENLMIVNVNEYSPTDNDIQYFSTTDAADNWYDGFVSYTFDNDYRADIVGLRNVPGNFYSAHADYNNTFDNVFYAVARNDTWSPQVSPMNHLDASVDVSPRPGIKLGGDDSCFVVWTEWYNNSFMWGSSGCDGYLTLARALAMGIFIEGYYNMGSYNMTRSDSVTVSYRQAFSPYNIVDSRKLPLFSNGYFLFYSNIIDVFTNYYLVVNHRSSIETWSAAPINYGGGSSYYYSFSSSNSQAYGNNEKFLETGAYGIYSGDVNQDENIDVVDMIDIYNDFGNSGYLSTDVNGDDYIDVTDIIITYNNATNVISVIKP